MKILCTDLEGTLAPEIWQEIGSFFGIEELHLTTRDIPDFDELMTKRMNILQKNNISYEKISDFVETIQPFNGAQEFLSSISADYQTVIVSDTFYELGLPVVRKLGNIPLLCHELVIEDDFIVGYKKRQEEPKKQVIKGFQAMKFECFCMGDSYNDIQMIDQSNGAFIFAPTEVKASRPDIISFESYDDLMKHMLNE
jgi:phosphoserine/homoserine phosphotransferase|tara:strand:- start:335 stop:925 length:591 start_codon:yes stop_codon:yes gene_type:complete